jgi:hypothetical protein
MPTVKSPHRPVPREHTSISHQVPLSLQQSVFFDIVMPQDVPNRPSERLGTGIAQAP